ncbi:hypothetical protein JXM83_00795 [Candidatus Woesearchaeota archaeon]|nr:hypothetical protein [Candidatus Woesearchaeota archaeon]
MIYLFQLSKDDLKLAEEEILSLIGKEVKYYVDDSVLVVADDIDYKELASRLAYTNTIYELISPFSNDGIEYSNPEFVEFVQEFFKSGGSSADGSVEYNEHPFDFSKYFSHKFTTFELLPTYEKNYSFKKVKLRGKNSFSVDEKMFAKFIYNRLWSENELAKKWKKDKKIVVDLSNAVTRYELLICENVSYFCRHLVDTDKSYNLRNTQYLPARHPSSMKSKLSRAFVNLTGVKKGGIVLDPFCGIGTCLIEAGFMGVNIIGSDISQEMLDRAKINFDYFNLKYDLRQCDARQVSVKCDFCVADLPYGKNTRNVDDLNLLTFEFLIHISKLCDVIVVGLPDFVDWKKIIAKTPWEVKSKFTYYLHKSLSKVILKLVKK